MGVKDVKERRETKETRGVGGGRAVADSSFNSSQLEFGELGGIKRSLLVP